MFSINYIFPLLIWVIYLHTEVAYTTSVDEFEVLWSSQRVRGVWSKNKADIILGGLFAIHNSAGGGGKCGEIRRKGGVERMIAMLYAIDLINNDKDILLNFTLGYDIRDTCSSENIGLDEGIALIKEKEKPSNNRIVGVVGASNSGVSALVAGVLGHYETPQISYASSSAILNDRHKFSNFFRTTPSDTLQAAAIVDLLRYFGWTHISTIYSDNDYGGPGIRQVQLLAEEAGICIDVNEGIHRSFSEQDFLKLAHKIIDSEAKVIVLFSSVNDAMKLFNTILRDHLSRFIWIASDFWAKSELILKTVNSLNFRMFGFIPKTNLKQGFNEYFTDLKATGKPNPWLVEWCSADIAKNNEICKQNTTHTKKYKQEPKIPLVIDAVYAFAHAINNFVSQNCQLPLEISYNKEACMAALNRSVLSKYVQNVNFTSPTGNRVMFDAQGNTPGSYEIINTQISYTNGTKLALKHTGTWSELEKLKFTSYFQFGMDVATNKAITVPPKSHCNKCKLGQFQRRVQSSCCGICDPCLGRLFSNNPFALNCSTCGDNLWGNRPLHGSDRCVPIPVIHYQFHYWYSTIILFLATVGLFAVGVTFAAFIARWNTPVAKSSSREHMMFLLMGISLCYLSVFLYVLPLNPYVCGAQRWAIWSAFSLMFGALLLKVVRIAIVQYGKDKLVKSSQLMKTPFQIMYTIFIVAIQWLILLIYTILDVPDIMTNIQLSIRLIETPTIVITCTREHVAFLIMSIAYQTSIILISIVVGHRSQDYPKNFREAKGINYASLTILVIWMIFLSAFFATQNEFRSIVISLAVVLSGYSIHIFIFGPRLYIFLLKPSQNTVDNSRWIQPEN